MVEIRLRVATFHHSEYLQLPLELARKVHVSQGFPVCCSIFADYR
jgi:hypothetical protein